MSEKLTKIESACVNTILDYFQKKEDFITHMRVQKLLYFSVGYCLVKYNTYIVEHSFQAWPYGPVLPPLYEELKRYRDTKVTEFIKFQEESFLYTEGTVCEGITETIKKLENKTAWELSDMSHDTKGPWFETVKKVGYKRDISKELIKKYFQSRSI